MHESRQMTQWREAGSAVDKPLGPVCAPAPPRVKGRRLNLIAIESSLWAVYRAFPEINAHLRAARDPLSEAVLINMMAGYAFIDTAIAAGVNLIGLGSLHHLLELNRLVLYGADASGGEEYASQLRATEAHFYGHAEGGIGSIVDWQASPTHRTPPRQAAGVYVRILSAPQLFIESKHRGGALVMSYLLAR